MRGIAGLDPGWGITVVRLVMGLILFLAGWQKWSAGMSAVAENFAKMGMPAPGLSGPFILILELVGGALLILGIASRWLGLLFAIQFVVATFFVKLPLGFNAARLDLMLLAGGILLFLAGPGRAAVDEVWLEKR
jgi:putative oxidoreductase